MRAGPRKSADGSVRRNAPYAMIVCIGYLDIAVDVDGDAFRLIEDRFHGRSTISVGAAAISGRDRVGCLPSRVVVGRRQAAARDEENGNVARNCQNVIKKSHPLNTVGFGFTFSPTSSMRVVCRDGSHK